jgi:transcriptional regulator
MDFAQEFLRRNAVYEAQYRNIVNGDEQYVGRDKNLNMARSWGLEFPHPS